ncbi:THUMP domain-containing protein 2 [Denticeps clupeoides]|uniref:THUMP domain-containing protein 2 n=1 Tax=Denticeps clupeoides TaxID=299321 RepID=UPI0010A475F8|nr:THUMP domain-containing protein 2 [Denticeps clupeoides]
MKEQSPVIRYFCTAGSGMEDFLVQEVGRKLSATDVERIPGRVFFSTAARVSAVAQLRSAERLFLLIQRGAPIAVPANEAKAAGAVQQCVLADPDMWTNALRTWSQLKAELEDAKGQGQKRKREEGEKCGKTGEESARAPSGLEPPTFRVSCRCSGAVARRLGSQALSRVIGGAIRQQLGWRADLREPNLEVNMSLSDDHHVLGIPLLRQPLATRRYLRHTGLRSTIAWALASLANIKEGCVVVDPMCGVGTILLEAAQECPNSYFLGLDADACQLKRAAENVALAQLQARVQLLQSCAKDIPFPSGSIDMLVCDVPFGRKFSCGANMSDGLLEIVGEMERVLCAGGTLVLLLSLQLSSLLKKKIDPSAHLPPHRRSPDTASQAQTCPSHVPAACAPQPLGSLRLRSVHRVSLGNTDALIHTYTKAQST